MLRGSCSPFSMNVLLALAMVACGLPTFAGCEFSFSGFNYTGQTAQASQQGTIGAEVKQVRIFNQFGDVVVQTASGETGWTWDGKVWADVQEQADHFIGELKLNVETAGDTQTWRLEMPADTVGLNGVESNLTIALPKSVAVSINNQHGNVRATEIGEEVSIDNAHGNVNVAQVTGNLTIENAHGNLVAETIAAATITARHGGADILSATGSVAIDHAHGTVNVDTVAGELNFSGRHCALKAANISGNARLANSHGDLTGKNIAGNVVAENQHGQTKIQTSGKTVQITSGHGSVDLDLQNSAFENVAIENKHSDIYVQLTQSSTPNVTMSVEHGDAKSEFDSDTSSSQLLQLTNRHGNIRVTKSASSEAMAEPTAEALPVDQ
jgi:hypothetical protein